MQLTTCLLCDFAQVREGLLFVASGGVTMLTRSEWPAPMGVHLALMLQMHPTEAPRPHELQIIVQGEDGQRIAEAVGGFQVEPDQLGTYPAGSEISIPFVLPLTNVPLNQAGVYSLEVLIDGAHTRTMRFDALEAKNTA